MDMRTGGSESESESEELLEIEEADSEGCFNYIASFNKYVCYVLLYACTQA